MGKSVSDFLGNQQTATDGAMLHQMQYNHSIHAGYMALVTYLHVVNIPPVEVFKVGIYTLSFILLPLCPCLLNNHERGGGAGEYILIHNCMVTLVAVHVFCLCTVHFDLPTSTKHCCCLLQISSIVKGCG